MLGYDFYYDKAGNHKYNNGSNQVNPTKPPEVVTVAVRPHLVNGAPNTDPNAWITKHDDQPDYVMTAKNANTADPDKQICCRTSHRTEPFTRPSRTGRRSKDSRTPT